MEILAPAELVLAASSKKTATKERKPEELLTATDTINSLNCQFSNYLSVSLQNAGFQEFRFDVWLDAQDQSIAL